MLYSETDDRYKTPLGAVRAGQDVRFYIEPDARYDGVTLAILEDGLPGPSLFSMRQTPDGYAYTHRFKRAGLFFYHFVLDDRQGIYRGADGQPVIAPDGGSFQQTVFSAGYRQPRGWAGGVMYQVFPDRFAIGGEVLKGPYADRVFHENLLDQPEFRPDAAGEVRNNDYFGGNLRGVEGKLDTLRELGVTILYLNPIAEAHANHRYNTADYLRVDPTLGTREDFVSLCRAAHTRGIKVVLDGVYSHTGSDSVYFNKNGRYPSVGAYQSRDSQYYSWYTFESYPDRYKGWWDFPTLPEIREDDPSFVAFICGEGGVIDHWMALGADGLRLDVADELPDRFIEQLREAVKRNGADKILIGEVWEDASNKISYGKRRRFLLGSELDSVMNYPFRTAVLDFVRTGDAGQFMDVASGIVRNYPKPMLDLMMNMLSTHDTPRALSALIFGDEAAQRDREWQSVQALTREQYLRGVEMLKLAMVLQYTLPGIPSIYYGDEIGMQGLRDPFNRGFMRWDAADENLRRFVRELGARRAAHSVFADGDFEPLCAAGSLVAFARTNAEETVVVAVNRAQETRELALPDGVTLTLAPWSYEMARV